MSYQLLELTYDAPVARLTLKSPPLNIIDIPLMAELNAALEELADHDEISILVMAGEGDSFSAGADVKDHTVDRVPEMLKSFHDAFRKLAALPIVTVARVQGHCLGGGAELACFADFVIAADTAKFGVPEIKLGCFPPVAAALWPELIGPRKTYEMITTGRTIDAATAEGWGLVTKHVPEDELDQATEETVSRLLKNSSVVLRMARRAIETGRPDFVKALDECERIYLDELTTTKDMTEGITAFIEKRKPVWVGA